MKVYGEILLSIIYALVILSVMTAVFTDIKSIFFGTGGSTFALAAYVFFVFAVFGFLVFGISGSIIWFLIYKRICFLNWSETKKHLIASISSAVICTPVGSLILGGKLSVNNVLDSCRLLVLVLPVTLVSVLFYWIMFLRIKIET